HIEAIGRARQAMGWLDAYDNPRERARVELGLNHLLTLALMGHRGYTSPEVSAAIERTEALIELLGEESEIVPAVWSLLLYHHYRGHLTRGRGLAERLLGLVRKTQDAAQEAAILPLLAMLRFDEGRLAEARKFAEQALALYVPETHRTLG